MSTLETIRNMASSISFVKSKGKYYQSDYIKEALKESNLDILGSGCFGVACCDPEEPEIAYKLFKTGERAYSDFLNHVLTVGGEHLPVIYSVVEVGAITIVEMEKLRSSFGFDYGLMREEGAYETLRLLDEVKNPDYGNDLHSGNWMIRMDADKGPVAVIIDPWSVFD